WSKIKFKGKEAYVSSAYLKNSDGGSVTPDPDPDTGNTTTKVVTATSLNVRSGPSTSNSVIGSLKQNEKVEAISESNGWSKIKFKGKEAYVSSAYLKNSDGGSVTPDPDPEPDTGNTTTKVVTATSLNVRSGPSTSNSVIGSLKQNEKVEVISESNGWSKIKFKGKEAYV
ncbi:SH3 domain-containing protein, partial [Paraclostridium bifermentans]|uniref:SH3 domain-containing protein n=1 Tax=Paraclostridium bifermentans TaxID=1490 RepID=UPI00359C9665